MYKNTDQDLRTGQFLIDMLDGCQHRGPDSTGFALYGDAKPGQLRVRFFIGEGDEATAAVQRIQSSLAEQNAEVVEDDLATPDGSESFEERHFIDKVDLSAKDKLFMAKAEADMERACADLINGDVPAEIIELAKK